LAFWPRAIYICPQGINSGVWGAPGALGELKSPLRGQAWAPTSSHIRSARHGQAESGEVRQCQSLDWPCLAMSGSSLAESRCVGGCTRLLAVWRAVWRLCFSAMVWVFVFVFVVHSGIGAVKPPHACMLTSGFGLSVRRYVGSDSFDPDLFVLFFFVAFLSTCGGGGIYACIGGCAAVWQWASNKKSSFMGFWSGPDRADRSVSSS